jgi:hypothetical protein
MALDLNQIWVVILLKAAKRGGRLKTQLADPQLYLMSIGNEFHRVG